MRWANMILEKYNLRFDDAIYDLIRKDDMFAPIVTYIGPITRPDPFQSTSERLYFLIRVISFLLYLKYYC